jgi:AcrR family transcriptional regulator
VSGAGLLPDPGGSHRDRLLAAMAESIRADGFPHTTVADVVRRARTSRRTFYQHFEDRESCYLALFDVLTERVLGIIGEAATGEGPWAERVDRTLAAYLGVLMSEPELTRSYIRDMPGMVAAGAAHLRAGNERAARQLTRMVEEAREHDPAVRPLPFEAALVIIGGLRELVLWALDEGRGPAEVQEVAGDLVRRVTLG